MGWTKFESVLRIKYDAAKDRGRGDHVVWEGNSGFGLRLYKSERRTWVQSGSRWDAERNKWVSYIKALGEVGYGKDQLDLKAARAAAAAAKLDVDKPVEKPPSAFGDTTLREAMEFWLQERNCAPSSKPELRSVITVNAGKLLEEALLRTTPNQLKRVYDGILIKHAKEEEQRVAGLAKLTEAQRLLQAPAGYFTGKKTARNFLNCWERVFRYWIKRHTGELQAAHINVPPCPTDAIKEDLVPTDRRVRSVPDADLAKLLKSFATYKGNRLHPPLIRLLLATGTRVGVWLGARPEWVHTDRITIPADAERSKVRFNKRGLESMAIHVPRTDEVNRILKALRAERKLYGERGKTWLFPSWTSESGHLEEEKMVVRALRKHAKVRFTVHQLRHVIATKAIEADYTKRQVSELLAQGRESDVTARYIDDMVIAHKKMLTRIGGLISDACK